MNLKLFFENLTRFYQNSLSVFEKNIDTYSFVVYYISEYERVYVIEDSFVVFVGMKQICDIDDEYVAYTFENDQGRFSTLTGHVYIIEELTYNEIFKINATKLKKEIFGEYAPYAHYIYKFFDSNIERPIKSLNFLEEEKFLRGEMEYLKTNFHRINYLLPTLDLAHRIEVWKGRPYTFVIYEVTYNGKKGYAVNNTTTPYTTKFITKTIREIEKSIRMVFARKTNGNVCANENELYFIHEIDGVSVYIFPYSLNREGFNETICWNNAMFQSILINKLKDYYFENNTDFKKSGELYPKFIPNNFLRYWTFVDYQKNTYFPEKYIDIIENIGEYIAKSHEPIEYHISENRWKSEEMVYECTKRLFKNNEIIHQHRPYFLHSSKGQMSYDVFVCGENIAIEYQGKQHFEPVDYFGGSQHFEAQQKRDELKRKLSEENGVLLIYINYWEDISEELIKDKITQEFEKYGKVKNKYYLR